MTLAQEVLATIAYCEAVVEWSPVLAMRATRRDPSIRCDIFAMAYSGDQGHGGRKRDRKKAKAARAARRVTRAAL